MKLSKSLTGTASIGTEELQGCSAKEISLEYYMIEVNGYSYELEQQRLYGIQVIKTEIDEANKINTETELIPDVSSNKDTVKGIIEKLVENKVTPICLMNVLEDIVGIN